MFKARCFPLLFWAKHHFSKDSIHLQSVYTSIFGRIPEIFNRWNTPRQDPYIAVLFRRKKSPISPYNMSLSFQMNKKLTQHLGTDWFQESCCDLGPWLYFCLLSPLLLFHVFPLPKKTTQKHPLQVESCQRAYQLLRGKLDFAPSDIIFDCLLTPVGSEVRASVKEPIFSDDFFDGCFWFP